MSKHGGQPIPIRRESMAERIARLVAEAPPFTPAALAEFSLIMGPALAELDAEADAAAVAAVRTGCPSGAPALEAAA